MLGSQRKVAILIVIGLALVASGAGAWALDTQRFSANVDEPIVLNQQTNWGDGMSMAPGDTVSSSVNLQSENDSQTVVVRLENWNGTLNTSGYAAARNGSGGYISEMEIGSAQLTFDLLNDGKADYHYLDSDETLTNTFNMTVPGDTAAGNVTYTVSYARGSVEAGSDLVKMHLSQGATRNCGNCHSNVRSDASVSRAHETLQVANQSCSNCHSASLPDIHMDCTGACHGDYPIKGHGPNQNLTVTADYRCGADCHGDQQELAHRYLNNGTCQTCHGNTASDDSTGTPDNLMTMHDSVGETPCRSCHGLGSEGIHRPYDDHDCGACHSGFDGDGFSGFNPGPLHQTPGECATCHSTSNQKLVHNETTHECTTCHNSSPITVGAMNHTATHSTCTNCHTDGGTIDLETMHEDPDDCASCHITSNRGEIHEETSIDCAICHPGRHRHTYNK